MPLGVLSQTVLRRIDAFYKFVPFAVFSAILYGIAHDLITANVCVEYFTEHHPKLVASQSPIMMALLWGVLATWWVGLVAGLVASMANGFGSWPKMPWQILAKRFLLCTGFLWASAMGVLLITWLFLGQMGARNEIENFEFKRRIMAVAITHSYSYTASAIVGLLLAVSVIVARGKNHKRRMTK